MLPSVIHLRNPARAHQHAQADSEKAEKIQTEGGRTMASPRSVPGTKSLHYVATLSEGAQEVYWVEQFRSPLGIRYNYRTHSDLYLYKEKRWLRFDHQKKEISEQEQDALPFGITTSSEPLEHFMRFLQEAVLKRLQRKTKPLLKRADRYLGVPVTWMDLYDMENMLIAQSCIGRVAGQVLLLRLVLMLDRDGLYAWDTVAVRAETFSPSLFSPPEGYRWRAENKP